MNFFSNSKFTELPVNEMRTINGGAPKVDSSFSHDIAWVIGRTMRGIWDGISGKYAGKDIVVLG